MRRKTIYILRVLFCIWIGVVLINKNEYQAATNYDNAKEFYESTGIYGESYHADVSNGIFYLSTKAKLASSSSNLKYYTLGYDICLYGNGTSVTFSVKRDGLMKQVSNMINDGYNYVLYQIDTQTLYNLAMKADKVSVKKVLDAPVIRIIANAIMTTKKGTTLNGTIIEDGFGGLKEDGIIYHLKNDAEWKQMMDIFKGHKFKSYRNIEEIIENYQLSIRYVTNGTDTSNENCSSVATVGSGYSQKNIVTNGVITKSVLHKNGEPVTTSARVLNSVQMLGTKEIGLVKKGYHLKEGKEWLYNNQGFSEDIVYMPKEICPEVVQNSRNIYVYANWQPNAYTISYDANGSVGTLPISSCIYDSDVTLRNNTFYRVGYHLKVGAEWNTKADGTGRSYSSGQIVKNLTSEKDKMITLYANWEADVYKITTDKQGGAGGANSFFEKYAVGWYKEDSLQNLIKSIAVPSKKGYLFLGYFENVYGLGTSIVDADGMIKVGTDYFTTNTMVYASYKAKQYKVMFDKQGGTGGTDNVVATYGKLLPEAIAPLRSGFTFLGYYMDKPCETDLYYSKHMACEKEYRIDGDSTLYAKWTDDIPPVVTIASETEHWTNCVEGIEITVSATDLGTGLDYVEVYCGNTLVEKVEELGGVKEKTVTLTHTTEGVFRYKAVAVDREGNRSESYTNCRYDIKAPKKIKMDVTNEAVDTLKDFHISVEITDYNVQ